jgi:hypothetical protein
VRRWQCRCAQTRPPCKENAEREMIRIELIPNRGVCSEHVEHASMSSISTQTQPEPRGESGGRRGLLRFVFNHLGLAACSLAMSHIAHIAPRSSHVPGLPCPTDMRWSAAPTFSLVVLPRWSALGLLLLCNGMMGKGMMCGQVCDEVCVRRWQCR